MELLHDTDLWAIVLSILFVFLLFFIKARLKRPYLRQYGTKFPDQRRRGVNKRRRGR